MRSMDHIQLDTWELAALESRDTYAKARSTHVRVYWTALAGTGAHVANVFSPIGNIFWSLDVHPAMDRAHSDFLERLRKRGGLQERIREMCAEVGASTHSAYATILLGALTRILGDHFVSHVPLPEYCLLDRRHMGFVVPDGCVPMVSRYLQRQMDALGPEALRRCDEDACLTLLELPAERRKSRPFLTVLEAPVGAVGTDELRRIAGEADAALADPDGWCSRHLKQLQYYDRGISTSVVYPAPYTKDFVKHASKVLRFRCEFAVRFFPLGALSRLRRGLDDSKWHSLEFADLREQLVEGIDRRLCNYGFISTNPLQEGP